MTTGKKLPIEAIFEDKTLKFEYLLKLEICKTQSPYIFFYATIDTNQTLFGVYNA